MTEQPRAPLSALRAEPTDFAAELQALVKSGPTSTTARTDPFSLQSFMDGGQRLYEKQRKAISEAESAYGAARTALADKFRVRRDELIHEAKEALRKLDEEHEARMAAGKHILEALAIIRSASRRSEP